MKKPLVVKKFCFKPTILFLTFIFSSLIFSQELHHQMLSSQGGTSTTYNGIVVTQTVGQSSLTGNYSSGDFKINQGFQQSNWARLITQNELEPFTDIQFYPNPVVSDINFLFSTPDLRNLNLKLFDTSGRNIFNKEGNASGSRIVFELNSISSGTYLLSLTNNQFKFYTRIIKK